VTATRWSAAALASAARSATSASCLTVELTTVACDEEAGAALATPVVGMTRASARPAPMPARRSERVETIMVVSSQDAGRVSRPV
jgi:hypothetical protein